MLRATACCARVCLHRTLLQCMGILFVRSWVLDLFVLEELRPISVCQEDLVDAMNVHFGLQPASYNMRLLRVPIVAIGNPSDRRQRCTPGRSVELLRREARTLEG